MRGKNNSKKTGEDSDKSYIKWNKSTIDNYKSNIEMRYVAKKICV